MKEGQKNKGGKLEVIKIVKKMRELEGKEWERVSEINVSATEVGERGIREGNIVVMGTCSER